MLTDIKELKSSHRLNGISLQHRLDGGSDPRFQRVISANCGVDYMISNSAGDVESHT